MSDVKRESLANAKVRIGTHQQCNVHVWSGGSKNRNSRNPPKFYEIQCLY